MAAAAHGTQGAQATWPYMRSLARPVRSAVRTSGQDGEHGFVLPPVAASIKATGSKRCFLSSATTEPSTLPEIDTLRGPRSAADEDVGRSSTGRPCTHRQVTDEQARVLGRGANVAVTQLNGRAFPAIHVQGDTFAELHRQLGSAVNRLRRTVGDSEALEDLNGAIEEMTEMLRFYESVLAKRGVRRPYLRDDVG
jgi:hypothetical protein